MGDRRFCCLDSAVPGAEVLPEAGGSRPKDAVGFVILPRLVETHPRASLRQARASEGHDGPVPVPRRVEASLELLRILGHRVAPKGGSGDERGRVRADPWAEPACDVTGCDALPASELCPTRSDRTHPGIAAPPDTGPVTPAEPRRRWRGPRAFRARGGYAGYKDRRPMRLRPDHHPASSSFLPIATLLSSLFQP